jgi:hypothetical protein
LLLLRTVPLMTMMITTTMIIMVRVMVVTCQCPCTCCRNAMTCHFSREPLMLACHRRSTQAKVNALRLTDPHLLSGGRFGGGGTMSTWCYGGDCNFTYVQGGGKQVRAHDAIAGHARESHRGGHRIPVIVVVMAAATTTTMTTLPMLLLLLCCCC